MAPCGSSRCGYLTESASNSRELTSAEMAHVERAVASFIRSESAYVSLPTLPKFRACSGMLKVHAAQRHSRFRALPLPYPTCFVSGCGVVGADCGPACGECRCHRPH